MIQVIAIFLAGAIAGDNFTSGGTDSGVKIDLECRLPQASVPKWTGVRDPPFDSNTKS